MSDKNLDQTFLSGSNSVFINDLLNKWENDPKSVPEEWSNCCLLYTSPSPRDGW